MLGVAAVGLIAFDWRLAIAALWSAPVALALLFASRRFLSPLMRATRMRNLAVSDDIQEALECVREVRATNQEERYLDGIRKHIDEAERQTVKDELATGICVNGAQIVLRLGIATTVLAGAALRPRGDVWVHDAVLLPFGGVSHLRAVRPVSHAHRRVVRGEDARARA